MDPGVGHLRMALEDNKEAIVTTSVVLYLGMYLLLGLTGVTFPAQLAAAYAPDSYTNPSPSGNEWVNTRDVTLSVDISDPEGDNIDATFYGDGSQQGTDSIASGGTAQTTWTSVSDGSHSWYVEGCDTNTNDPGGDCSTSSTWNFRVDATNPSVSASHSPSQPTDSDTVSFEGTASDGGSGLSEIRVYVDSTLQNTCASSPCTYEGGPYTAGSSHSYRVEADDVAGNTNSDTGSFTVNNPPNAPSNPSPSDGAVVSSGSQSLSADYSDPDGDSGTLIYRYASNDSNIGSCSVSDGGSCSVTWSGMSDGQHSWYAVAQDTHGDSTTGSTWSFTVDTSGPSVSASTTSPTDDRREEVDYTVSDPRFNSCSASGASVSWSCSESSTGGDSYDGTCTPQSDMQDGTYTVTVSCDDTGGNSGSDQVQLAVDTTPPSITCNDCDSPDPVRNGNEITFTPSTGDGVSGVDTVTICEDSSCSDVYCSYDAEVSSSCSYQTPDFSYTTNDYWVRATDNVGNSRTTGSPEQFTIKKWVGQSCSVDDECLIGSCVDGTCQIQRIPAPIIILR